MPIQKLVEIHKQNEADYFPGKLSNTIIGYFFPPRIIWKCQICQI